MASVYLEFYVFLCFIFTFQVHISAQFVNVAVGKSAYQSSYHDSYQASTAVDGVTTQNGNNFMHTGLELSYTWWEVDLGKLYFVHEVKIYFRTSSKTRRRGVQIYTNTAVNSSNTGHLCGNVTGREDGSDIPDVVNFTCNVNVRYVTVYQGIKNGNGAGTILDFLEVEVYACEVNVKYGSNCDKLCEKRHCVNTNSSCDVQTGKCDTAGCTAGWNGTDCREECSSGTYGKNCKSRCGNCRNKLCDRFYGNCTGGCTEGYEGILCKQTCEQNVTYGADCKNLCENRHCVNSSVQCDTQTGSCVGGCRPGWLKIDCTQKCDHGKYGQDCNSVCGNCKNKTCHFVSGNCTNGCIHGFVGDFCTQKISESEQQTFIITGSVIGVAVVTVVVLALIFVLMRRRRMSTKENTEDSNQVKWNSKQNKSRNESDYTYEFVDVDLPTRQSPEGTEDDGVKEEDCEVTLTINSPVEETDEQEVETAASVYYNVSNVQLPEGGVLVSELSTVIQKIRRQPGGFESEFKKMDNGFTSSYKESQVPENKEKNRFKGYYPYDKNRVVLTMLPDVAHSDYINASLVDAYEEKDYFIAAQAPNKKTLRDFWRMLWEKKCSKIIMLCNLVEDTKVKCEAYWSDEEMKTIGPFTVVVTEKLEKCDFVIRKMSVTHRKTGKTQTFQQFHFITWPDHGIPNVYDFTEFLYQVRKSKSTLPGPVLVHCSAGVGRTGTFIALDILLDEMEATGKVDVFKVITRLRDQRKGLVQTEEQYEMLFVALLEMASYGVTSMDNSEFYLKYQQQNTSLVMGKKTVDELALKTASPDKTENTETADTNKVWIDGRQDFYAFCLPSKVSKLGYLLIPRVKDTEESFWKLVLENDSYTVITFDNESCVGLIPSNNESVKHGKVTVTALHQTSVAHEIMENTLQIETHGDKEKREIRHYCIQGWLPTTDSVTLITCLTTISEKLQQQKGKFHPVSFVYRECEAKNVIMLCIANNILFGTKLDTEVEIFNNIRRLQTILPNVTFTKDDFVLFCNLAFLHLESSSVYANCPTSQN